jgi:hypothetical protein
MLESGRLDDERFYYNLSEGKKLIALLTSNSDHTSGGAADG